jgi:mannose-6-phosphate isomerase-like protein (cupin superfamily)
MKRKVILRNYNENTNSLMFKQNSWVNFTILDIGAGYKVERFEVLPLKRLSFQKNKFDTQHWTIVQGTAKVTINDQIFFVKVGETIDVEVGETHCVENTDNSEILVFINIQHSFYIAGDDIIRFSDVFCRVADAA